MPGKRLERLRRRPEGKRLGLAVIVSEGQRFPLLLAF